MDRWRSPFLMDAAWQALLLGLTLLVLLPASPYFRLLPFVDSSVFLYVGQRILEGDIPYRDVWDHKGPAVFYINALGLWLGRGSLWGVWLLNVLALYSAAVIGWVVQRQSFDSTTARLAALYWLFSAPIFISGGNLTEIYALPFQFLTIGLFWRTVVQEESGRTGFGIGICFAALLLLRPNLAALPLISALLLAYRTSRLGGGRPRHVIRDIALGLGSLLVPVAAYFAWHGALQDGWDAVVRFNFVYINKPWQQQLGSIGWGIALGATKRGLPLLALAGWGVVARQLWQNRTHPHRMKARLWLLALAFITLPLELWLSGLSGGRLSYHFLPWLPSATFLISGLLHRLQTTLFSHNPGLRRWGNGLLGFALLFALLWQLRVSLLLPLQVRPAQQRSLVAIRAAVMPYTEDTPYLLMWGNFVQVNLLTDRPAPTRFVYQAPLYTCGYTTPELVAEFTAAVARTHPIILAERSNTSGTPPLDPNQRSAWARTHNRCNLIARLASFYQLIDNTYDAVGVIPGSNWVIYRPRSIHAGGIQ